MWNPVWKMEVFAVADMLLLINLDIPASRSVARKLRGEEKEAWVLLLGTSYGDKRFQLEEVKRILLIRGETQKDVTALVMEQSKEA